MKTPTPEQVSKVMASLGKKGGPARAQALTPEERKEIARKAAAARWAGKTSAKKAAKKAK
jgi:hypothetical protein